MKQKIPVYECKIMGADNTGIFAISFVDTPANESNFIALNKQKPIKLALNKQKQILTGVVLVPDQLIYRYDENLGEYYIKFTTQDIEKIAQKMMKTGLALSTTTHQHEKPLEGNYLTEIWLVFDSKKDKAAALGLGELPVGTLVASYKIEDSTYWRNQVLTGEVKGFSLEGIFNFNSVTMKKKTKTVAQLGAAKKTKLTAFGLALHKMGIPVVMEGETEAAAEDLTDVAADDETDSGDPVIIFELADGGEIWVDADGFATLDGGEQMPAGEHALADGNFIVIDDSGMMVVTQPEADGAEAATAATDLAKKTQLARQRGKQFLAKVNTKEAKIAALEKQIAELKKQPSTGKAEARINGGGKKDGEALTHTEKMAKIVANRRARAGK